MNGHTEEFWKGRFGNDYSKRQANMVDNNLVLFSRILSMMDPVSSILELGCGTGMNLEALKVLVPEAGLDGVEINPEAAKKCKVGTVHNRSIKDFAATNQEQWQLVFTKGLMIHIPPDDLPAVYRAMHAASKQYILIAEYYNPTPMEILYRGHTGVMWKRDFAGEMLDGFSDLRLVDSGFAYHRGPYPQDDLTWMLLERVAGKC